MLTVKSNDIRDILREKGLPPITLKGTVITHTWLWLQTSLTWSSYFLSFSSILPGEVGSQCNENMYEPGDLLLSSTQNDIIFIVIVADGNNVKESLRKL